MARSGGRVVAIEVKSNATGKIGSGAASFAAAFKPHRTLLVGGDGIAIEEFLARPVAYWLQE